MSDSGRDAIRERLLKYGVVSRKWGVANARHKEDFYTTITYMRNHGYKITKEKLPRDTLYYLDDFKIGRGRMKRIDDRFEKLVCWVDCGDSDDIDDIRRRLAITVANELIRSGVAVEDIPYGALGIYGIQIYAKRTIKNKEERNEE